MTSTATTRTILIGTRGSALARAQAALVAQAIAAEGRPHRIVVVETAGDRRAPDTAWGEGAFVAAIERALLDGRVDVAVHSAKDVPTDEDPALRIAAFLPRADPRDALVGRPGARVSSLADLAPGAIVGTDSPRRSAFVRACRPDLVVRPLHGNVDTRLRRLDEGEADALVLAVAGLVRLGREDRISAVLDPEVVPPAPGQGAIAVQIRAGDGPLIALGAGIDDPRTRLAVETERAFLRASGGGCRSPIGALATVDGQRIRLFAGVARDPEGSIATGAAEGAIAEAPRLATELAGRLRRRLQDGGDDAGPHRRAHRPVALLSRPLRAGDPLTAALAGRGIEPVSVPAIAIERMAASEELDAAVRPLAADDWIVVTSANGVRAVADHLNRLGIRFAALRWAAVGTATAAALRAAGAEQVWRPSRADATTLVTELPLSAGAPGGDVPDAGPTGISVGIVRGRLGDSAVAEGLRARGATVHEAIVYETREAPAASRPALDAALARDPAAAVLASPSAARGLLELAGPDRERVLAIPAICIGPRTAAAAVDLGYQVAATAVRPEASLVADAVATVASVGAPGSRA